MVLLLFHPALGPFILLEMKMQHLGFILFLTLLSFSSQAQEEKKLPHELLAKDVFFQPGGGIRVRYDNLRQATGGGFPGSEDESQATHRAQFDFKIFKGEYFETFFRFLNFAEWGAALGDTNGGQHDAYTRSNGVLVNQAYGVWKIDDYVDYIRFGRAPLKLGLGYTYGSNDWFNVPYSFDLLETGWDWGGVSLNLIAAKLFEFSTVSGQSFSSDPEENHIIINLDIKNPLNILEFMNFNVVQVNRDLGSTDGTNVLNALNAQRFSLESKIEGKNIFGSIFLSYVTGEERVAAVNVLNNIDKLTLSQTALDFKLGYAMPQWNNLRFWAGYHTDSGDKNPLDSNSQSYNSFYYEVYGQAGYMDLLRWGNLSFYRAGMSVDVATNYTIGADWWSFSRTEGNDSIRFGNAGRFFKANVDSGALVFGNDTNLGRELDLWMDAKFQSGVKVRVTFTDFFPGSTFSQATGPGGAPLASNSKPDSDIRQFLAQVGYFF